MNKVLDRLRRRVLTVTQVVLAMGLLAGGVQASTELLTAADWKNRCANLATAENQALCYTKLLRGTAGGRSLGAFQVVEPEHPGVLQSRSGVFFRTSLNRLIDQVHEDSGRRTRLGLKNETQCQTYTSPSSPLMDWQKLSDQRRLIQAWLTEYTDVRHGLPEMATHQREEQGIVEFRVSTAARTTIRGYFVRDARLNATIFSTCEFPAESLAARETAGQFFGAVLGSARNYQGQDV